MTFRMPSPPYTHQAASVSTVMMRVVYALIPGIAAYAWFFGPGIAINILFATAVALACEALMLKIREQPLRPFLTDGSAVVTAVLLALSLPPLAPWWITLIGTAFAIVVAKHLYGGLGYNPFNPAMMGFAMLLISFPRELTLWQAPMMLSGHSLGIAEAVGIIFGGHVPASLTMDALTSATPLDTIKVQLRLDHSIADIMQTSPVFGSLGGKGWEWINIGFLLGGLWMMYKRVITWHIPAAMLGSLTLLSLIFWMIQPEHFASPLFHLFTGAAILGAFFIATDPVSASTTPRGRLVYGAGIGLFTYVIRTFGGYPDGVAFAVLLMNIAAPTLDYYTKPRVFGQQKKKE
jgi:electron transport complex protein RnfD